MSSLAAGLVHTEGNRGDGSLGTFLGVQAGLAMRSIAMLGSEEQKQRWLLGLARVEGDRRVRTHRARARLGLDRARDDRPPGRRQAIPVRGELRHRGEPRGFGERPDQRWSKVMTSKCSECIGSTGSNTAEEMMNPVTQSSGSPDPCRS
jgi:hypothetical protein